jgi:hypothetical protein
MTLAVRLLVINRLERYRNNQLKQVQHRFLTAAKDHETIDQATICLASLSKQKFL